LMDDKFSVAFEFYINVGHALVERAGVSQNFADLVWQQAESGVRGETSLDAWEARKLATAHGPDAEKFKTDYLAASFADAISIYLLSSISMSIITICANATTRCWRPLPWPSASARSPKSFPRIQDSSSASTIAAAPETSRWRAGRPRPACILRQGYLLDSTN